MGQTQSQIEQQVLCEGVIWSVKEHIPIACGYQFYGERPNNYVQSNRLSDYHHINPELYKMREYSKPRRVAYVERPLPNPQPPFQPPQFTVSKTSRRSDKQQNKQQMQITQHQDLVNIRQHFSDELLMTKHKSAYQSLHQLGDDDIITTSPDEVINSSSKPTQLRTTRNNSSSPETSIPNYPTATSIEAETHSTVANRPHAAQRYHEQANHPSIQVNQAVSSRANTFQSSTRNVEQPVFRVISPEDEYRQGGEQSNQSLRRVEMSQAGPANPQQNMQHTQMQFPQYNAQQAPSHLVEQHQPPHFHQISAHPQHSQQYSAQQVPHFALPNFQQQVVQSSSQHIMQSPRQDFFIRQSRQNQNPFQTQHLSEMFINSNQQTLDAVSLPLPQRLSIQDSPQELATKRNQAMQQRFRQIAYYYSEHNIDFAFHRSQQLLKQFQPEFKGHPAYKDRMRFLELLATEYKDIISYWSEFNKPSWQLKSNENGVKVSTCYEDGNVAVLVESELRVPIEIFCAVITEINLYPKFTPFMVYSKEEKRIARNSKIGHSINEFPILSTREAFFQGIGYNRLDTNNTLFLYTRSVHNRPDLQQLYDYRPNPKKDSVLLQYKYLCLEYTPIRRGVGYLRICINVNMKIRLVPKFVLEAATKKFGQQFFDNIYRISKDFQGSEWEQAVQRDPELFNYFRGVMEDFYGKHGMG